MNLIKRMLKKIFPRFFLKQVFLIYNRLKAKTLDKLFFLELTIPQEEFFIYQKKNPFLEIGIDISSFDDTIKNKLVPWTNPEWTQDQYLLIYKSPAFIEPKVGWAVTTDRKLIYPSLSNSRAPHIHKPSWFETYFKKPKVVNLTDIISLRDTGEETYFHFFNDVLAKLFFLQEHNIDLKAYTIVVAQRLYSKKYFQYYLKNTFLGSLTWHTQKEEWIFFKTAVFCKPQTHSISCFKKAVALLGIPTNGSKGRRIFLTRRKDSRRHLSNSQEILKLMREFNFEIIEAGDMPFENQITLFSETSHLIAIHGAGIANIIFRNNHPLYLLEIVPSMEYIPYHYIMLAKQFNYQYNVILGYEVKGDGGFRVNPGDIKTQLEKIGY